MEDTRNLKDEYKGLPNEEVFLELDKKRSELEVAIENLEHDFNVGSIVRTANNFNVATVHIVGRHKYNRRGAMCTDKYMRIKYWSDLEEFLSDQKERGREIVAIENNTKFVKGVLGDKVFLPKTTLVLGSEGNGISEDFLKECQDVREIESFGSTRSINVGAAASIAMWEYSRQMKYGVDKPAQD